MFVLSVAEAAARLDASGETYVRLRSDDAGDLALYRPVGIDPQTPHQRDEVYVIASGSGTFVQEGEERAVAVGDLIHVPAGTDHRFVNFTDDFATWVIFFGPVPGRS